MSRAKGRSDDVRWSRDHDAWLVRSHELAKQALLDEALSLDTYSASRPSPLSLPSSFELESHDNLRVRRALSECIGFRRLPHDVIQQVSTDVLAEVPVGHEIEFASEVSEPLALRLTCGWFGMPTAAVQTLMAYMAASSDARDDVTRDVADILAQRALREAISAARREGRHDMLGDLCAAWERYDLEDDWLIAFLGPMINALAQGIGGRLITHSMALLLLDPGLQESVAGAGFVGARLLSLEAARLFPINQAVPRVATRDLKLGPAQLRSGDRVLIVVPDVCRDYRAYADPDVVELSRRGRDNLAFGFGVHACSGRELALSISATAIAMTLGRPPRRARQIPSGLTTVVRDFGPTYEVLPLILEPKQELNPKITEGGEKYGNHGGRVNAVESHAQHATAGCRRSQDCTR
ncbi:MAG: cytochrome P450 [Jatrophihabitans sp.]